MASIRRSNGIRDPVIFAMNSKTLSARLKNKNKADIFQYQRKTKAIEGIRNPLKNRFRCGECRKTLPVAVPTDILYASFILDKLIILSYSFRLVRFIADHFHNGLLLNEIKYEDVPSANGY